MMKLEFKRKRNLSQLTSVYRLERITQKLFGEKVEFDAKANENFEKQLQDIDLHFEDHEKEDYKLDVDQADVAGALIK